MTSHLTVTSNTDDFSLIYEDTLGFLLSDGQAATETNARLPCRFLDDYLTADEFSN